VQHLSYQFGEFSAPSNNSQTLLLGVRFIFLHSSTIVSVCERGRVDSSKSPCA
jgi:hypothetical protein